MNQEARKSISVNFYDNRRYAIISFLHTTYTSFENVEDLAREMKVVANFLARKSVIIDCGNVEFGDSAFISTLVVFRKKMKGRLIVCNTIEHMSEKFSVSHLDSVFEIVDTVEEAQARIKSA